MLIQIIKDIPISRMHNVNLYSIYKVHKELPDWWLIISQETFKGVWIKKTEAQIYKGRSKMNYKELAKCIKFMQRMKYKVFLGHYNIQAHGSNTIKLPGLPIEHYFINEFPFDSSFCYIFRNHRVKDKTGQGAHVCYCPFKPYENPQWPVVENTYLDKDGETVTTKRRTCSKFKSAKTGAVKFRTHQKMLEMVESIPISEIVKHLKRIQLKRYQIKILSGKWFLFIKHRVEEWEHQNRKEFV